MSEPTRKKGPLPAGLKPELITAIVDSREQTPLNLSPLQVERGTLTTGDYSIKGLENIVSVERKSLQDMIGCIGSGRERFEREIMRLLAYPCRALVIESEWRAIELGGWRGSIKPAQATGSILGWIAAGIPVVLAGNHEQAGRIVSRMLIIAARRRWDEARTFAAAAMEEEPAHPADDAPGGVNERI